MKKLRATARRIRELQATEIDTMFALFTKYYENVSRSQFIADLNKKDHVFLLKDTHSFDIKGFSTLVSLSAQVNGRCVRAFFSGDTVVDREYWGQGTLGVAFLFFLFLHKLRHPFQPLYWFLISKGYKTYLLMANNFAVHYPRYEKPTPPEMQALIDTFSTHLYGQHYQTERGVISFTASQDSVKDTLRQHITPITPELLKNPRIAFFQARNPGWVQGDELACIARMTLSMPFYYQFKHIWKRLARTAGRSTAAQKPPSKGVQQC